MDLENENIANLNAIKWHVMTQNNSCSEWRYTPVNYGVEVSAQLSYAIMSLSTR